MTEEEIVALEVERKACLDTAMELCKHDGYMDTNIAVIVDSLRRKAKEIENKIREELMGR